MLNELLKVRQTLDLLGVPFEVKHGDLKAPAKRPLLCIVLSDDFTITRIETKSAEEAQKHWTLREGKHNSFPHMQIKRPLRQGVRSEVLSVLTDVKVPLDKRLEAFERAVEDSRLDETILDGFPTSSFGAKMRKRADALASLSNRPGKQVLQLFRLASDIPGRRILEGVDSAVQQELARNPSNELFPLAVLLLFSATEKSSCDLLWDWEDPENGKRASAPGMAQFVSAALIEASGDGDAIGTCALTGAEAKLESNKFPEANLPLLGPTSLFARNPAIPCAKRYRLSGVNSMPVARNLCGELQASIVYLTNEEKKGTTWDSLPSEKPGQSDLLIAYINENPEAGAVSCLRDDEAGFEELTSRLNRVAAGNKLAIPENACLEVVIIRKVDTANKKVIHSGSYSFSGFLGAAADWDAGFRNLDGFSIWLPPKKKGNAPHQSGIRRLAPASLVYLLKRQFTKDGTEHAEVLGIPFSLAFRLFLDHPTQVQPIAERILHLTIERSRKLIMGVGEASRNLDALRTFDRRAARDFASLLALLLWKINRKKEVFMKDSAFLLGQLLATADALHYGYCLDQRGGSIPPSLLGNSLLTLAERNPAGALAQLLTRLKPYYGWATKARSGNLNRAIEEAKAAKTKDSEKSLAVDRAYKIRAGAFGPISMETLASQLHGNLPLRGPDDVFRAELLLGYLAGPPRKEKDGE